MQLSLSNMLDNTHYVSPPPLEPMTDKQLQWEHACSLMALRYEKNISEKDEDQLSNQEMADEIIAEDEKRNEHTI